MEEIDIFDADLRPLGKKDRKQAHQDGDWHRTFHLWVVGDHKGGSMLYQWRSADAKNFPDMLDVSAAGHLMSGEAMEQGIREATEELGIPLDIQDVHDLGFRVEVADQANGQKNREYQGVHMHHTSLDLSAFAPQVEEVAGLYWVPLKAGMDLFLGETKTVEASGIYFDKGSNKWQSSVREFSKEKFLPRIQQYYLTAHIMGERLLESRFPLAIS